MFVLSVLTAIIWGVTNWFLKRGSMGLRTIQYDNRLKQFAAEIWYFFTNAQVLVAMIEAESMNTSSLA